MDMMKTLTASAAALALSVGMASAATVTINVIAASHDGSTLGAGSNTADVFAGNYGAFTGGGVFDPAPSTNTGTSGVSRSPWQNTATDLTGRSYFATGPDNPTNPAILTFGTARSTFTLLWGSVDSYNELTFGGLGSGGSDITITGSQVAAAVGTQVGAGICGDPSNFACTVLVSFSLDNNETFTTVEFFSRGSNAFEFAMIPLPASALLLLGGMGVFGGMAAIRRRKEKPSA